MNTANCVIFLKSNVKHAVHLSSKCGAAKKKYTNTTRHVYKLSRLSVHFERTQCRVALMAQVRVRIYRGTAATAEHLCSVRFFFGLVWFQMHTKRMRSSFWMHSKKTNCFEQA